MARRGAVLLAGFLVSFALIPAGDEDTGGTMARLARLLEGGERADAVDLLREALRDRDPRVRGAAARIILVINLGDLEERVRNAVSVETDPAAAREMARAITSLSDPPFDDRGGVPLREAEAGAAEAEEMVELSCDGAKVIRRDTPRTLADLPAGFAEAVLDDAGCEMPDMATIGVARVAYHHGLRPAAIELSRMPFTPECREAAKLLLRAGLRPDSTPNEPGAWQTLYIVLGADQAARFDEQPPSEPTGPIADPVIPPERTVFAKPGYPESMRKIQGEGKVVLEFVVDRRGVPGSICVLRSAGGAFDQSAVLALSQWRFKPASRGGVPMPVHLTGIFDFNCK